MIRIGVDFGGTKIEAAALDADSDIVARVRGPSPPDYGASLESVAELVMETERLAGIGVGVIGVGGPGSPSPVSGLMRNANSAKLNGRPFPADLERALGRTVRYANDANCLALSEATDGAGQGHGVVFAAILGTGCGAGVTVDGRLLAGRNAIAGEWGHMPLPWASAGEASAPACWCGRRGCMELYVAGPGLARDHGKVASAEDVVRAARAGDGQGRAALERYIDRLARGLAVVCDVLDPDVIVLGGGMSNVAEIYVGLQEAIGARAFTDSFKTPVVPAVHGDSSGVRGAAWLWRLDEIR